jgi:hypothetical protein
LKALDERQRALQAHLALVARQRHASHPNERIARTQAVQEINQFFFASINSDEKGLFLEKGICSHASGAAGRVITGHLHETEEGQL